MQLKNMHIHIIVILLPESKSFRLLVNPLYANNALKKKRENKVDLPGWKLSWILFVYMITVI